MAWKIKHVLYYGESIRYGPDYIVTEEVKYLLSDGWKPFCVTYEKGEIGTYPWLWLKKKDNESRRKN